MKFTVFVLVLIALVVVASGHPLEAENEANLSVQSRTIPFLRKRVKEHRNRLFQIGEGLISTTQEAVSGLGSIIKSGDLQGPFLCAGCKAAVETLRYQVKNGRAEEIYPMIENTCTLLNIQTREVCSGIAHLFGPELIPILNTTLDGLFICSFLLTHDCTKVELPQWVIPLPPSPLPSENTLSASYPSVGLEHLTVLHATDLPHRVQPQCLCHVALHTKYSGPLLTRGNDETRYLEDSDSKLKVLHLTDTHYDRSYREGAKVNCREPLCCRIQNGLASGKEKGAGKWGDWNCDIPERTLDSMLQHAANTHPDIDYIIWTGDIPAHDIWNQSKEANSEILRSTVEKVKGYFPRTPVFPSVGNHETAPTDIFPLPREKDSPFWLYNELDKEWSYWLPNSTSDTIRRGAFYTALVRPGLRIVSLNTNYCYHRNWWLMINSTDPADQLRWFVDVLERAERQKEKVHVIAHVPPGQTDCLPTWRDNYYRIVSRFRNTIVGLFYGHTHKDEFEIYYDDDEEVEPVGVGYIGPSVTTFTNLNPGYRIYYVDGDSENSSRGVIDYENWVLDLEYTNKNDEPKWSKSYSAKEEFQMSSLSPKDWNALYNRLKTDEQFLQRYYMRSNKDSPESKKKPCDRHCKKAILCAIRSCAKYD